MKPCSIFLISVPDSEQIPANKLADMLPLFVGVYVTHEISKFIFNLINKLIIPYRKIHSRMHLTLNIPYRKIH
jgi:hypothetical protein